MEELKEGWRRVRLGDVIDFNPKETLKKNTMSKYVEMAQLQCFARNIIGYSFKEYKGGTKFRNGDTLLARITPCLENGKTAFVDILEEDEVGFGSTEYIVLRKKEGYTDENYIFYLAISDLFRQIAIKSMTGTSGRQRVQTEVLKNSEIVIPEVNIQKKIASILSLLDEKIELNRKINQNLEETAQTLFKRWFIDFEFPNEEGKPYKSSGGKMIESEIGKIPEGWRVGKLGEFIKIQNGYAFKSKDFLNKGDIGIIKIKNISNKIIDILNTDFISNDICKEVEDKYLVNNGDILIAMTGAEIGKIGIVPQNNKQLYLNQRVGKIVEVMNGGKEYSYFHLNQKKYQELIFLKSSGSAQPNISASEIENIEIIFPTLNLLNKFKDLTTENFFKIIYNLGEIEYLLKIRDYLLPRLMNGEISV
ncbi:restriction endonuclease subunit S [uncultured Fusobacterium sp.]|uniref:restriction endonuclease subunit S n=1 Tax=uncultured Fusobacterium sp. TaxID=159267 RepID=UPI0026221FE3|nr:restriction endonuclease subunit S [uncultured Fusobacterium sp.]